MGTVRTRASETSTGIKVPRGHRRFRSVVATLGALALATAGATLGAGTAAAALPTPADVQVELQTPFFTAGGTDVTTTVTVTDLGSDLAFNVGTFLTIPPGYTVKDNGGGSAIEGSVGGVDQFFAPVPHDHPAIYTVILTAPPGAGVAVTSAYAFSALSYDPNIFNNVKFGLTFSA
ncbi:MAG: hypothetical protein ACXVXN_05780 [Mycobacteriaceae bacterium]